MKHRKQSLLSNERYIVPAVEQSSRIMLFLMESEAASESLTRIAARLGIHKSKAFSILNTLQKFGFVLRNREGKGYSLGPAFIGVSKKFVSSQVIPSLAAPILKDLAKKTNTTAVLGLVSDRKVFVAAQHEGGSPMSVTMKMGQRLSLTYGSHGKAIAAFLPGHELDDLLKEKKLYFYGDPSRFDLDALMRELEECRTQWYALDLGETAEGFNTVAAPVLDPSLYPVAYIVLLGVTSKEITRQHGPLVAESGRLLSRQLGTDVEHIDFSGGLSVPEAGKEDQKGVPEKGKIGKRKKDTSN
jgi:DNA-binding IclR family transcriptional regulator